MESIQRKEIKGERVKRGRKQGHSRREASGGLLDELS